MKLAIVLRGIFYNDLRNENNIPENNLKILYTDYRLCLPSFRENLISELDKVFNEIDIYIVTYQNDMLEQIKIDYNVKDSLIYDKDKMFGTFTMENLADIMIDGIELFKKNNIDEKYTHFLLTRPDLYFFKKFNLEKLDLEKVNFGWTHAGNHNCDNFILTPTKFIDRLMEPLRKEKYSHTMQRYFDSETMNFISRPISPDGEHVQADFYVVLRNLEKYKRGEFITD